MSEITNIDQTMCDCDSPPSATHKVRGAQMIYIAVTGAEKRGFTVCLGILADGRAQWTAWAMGKSSTQTSRECSCHCYNHWVDDKGEGPPVDARGVHEVSHRTLPEDC